MLRKYQDTDFEEVKSWGKQWGADYDKDLLSPSGYIVPGVAAYFIYYTKSKSVWLENMVSNKEVAVEIREQALQQIVSAILEEVKQNGCKVAYATTDISSVIDRAKLHHASAAQNQTLLILKLN